MSTWEEIQAHAKRMIEEGMRILRSGMSDASFLAESTAEAAKLHVTLRRNRLDRYKAMHELGELVCEDIGHNDAITQITLSDEMRKKIKAVRDFDEEAQKFEEAISKLTVIRKQAQEGGGAPQARAKQRPAAKKKAE
jgi:hypothetical protein